MANLYQKIAITKQVLSTSKMKKSGKNTYSGYDYFELGDFMPIIVEQQNALNFVTLISFGAELATLTAIDCDDPSIRETITCPMSTASLKGCHQVQNDGAVQTYLRRYLYTAMFDITEHDALDATTGKDPVQPKTQQAKSKEEPKVNQEQLDRLMAMAIDDNDRAILSKVRDTYGYKTIKDLKQSEYDKFVNDFGRAVAEARFPG